MHFIIGLCALLVFQLIGEILSQPSLLGSVITLSGPVLGMFLLFLWLISFERLLPALHAHISFSATSLLNHLSLLFIPAGVGLIVYLERIQSQWLAISAAIVLGTIIAMLSTAFSLIFFNRITNHFSNTHERKKRQRKAQKRD